jgi:hypothetical protein
MVNVFVVLSSFNAAAHESCFNDILAYITLKIRFVPRSKIQSVSANRNQWVSIVFLGAVAHTEFVFKIRVALYVSHTAFPPPPPSKIIRAFRQNTVVPTLSNYRHFAAFEAQLIFSAVHSQCVPFFNSNALPSFRFDYIRKSSGHSLGTFRGLSFTVPPTSFFLPCLLSANAV